MGLFGIFLGVYLLYVFQRNRDEFIHLRDEADDRKRILYSHSMASLRSMNSTSTKHPLKARYPSTAIRGSPSTATGYESDNNSTTVLYQSRPSYNIHH